MWLAGTSKAYAPLALGLVTRFLEDRNPEQQPFTTSEREMHYKKSVSLNTLSLWDLSRNP